MLANDLGGNLPRLLNEPPTSSSIRSSATVRQFLRDGLRLGGTKVRAESVSEFVAACGQQDARPNAASRDRRLAAVRLLVEDILAPLREVAAENDASIASRGLPLAALSSLPEPSHQIGILIGLPAVMGAGQTEDRGRADVARSVEAAAEAVAKRAFGDLERHGKRLDRMPFRLDDELMSTIRGVAHQVIEEFVQW
jgi:hypothetical protein